MRVPLRLTLTTLALIGTAVPLAAETRPAPIVKIEGRRQISVHVYIVLDNSVPLVPNVGNVIGDRAPDKGRLAGAIKAAYAETR